MSNLLHLNKNFVRDDIDFADHYAKTKHQRSVVKASIFADDLEDRIKNGRAITGSTLPWSATHSDIRFRPGGLSVWSGINGHGKSTLLLQAAIGFVAQGEPVVIASFEIEPIDTIEILAQQAAGCDPSSGFGHKFLEWAGDRLYIYNSIGATDQQSVLGAMKWCAENYGAKHFIVDNLMMMTDGDAGDRAMNSQKDFVANAKRIAQDCGIHVHLVHHIRKGDDEAKIPNKMDVIGSSAITNLADYVFIVWKNKARARHLQKPESLRKPDPKLDDASDALLVCDKNRRTGVERFYPLWFNQACKQFTPDRSNRPLDVTRGQV